jgi:hypothetical protein
VHGLTFTALLALLLAAHGVSRWDPEPHPLRTLVHGRPRGSLRMCRDLPLRSTCATRSRSTSATSHLASASSIHSESSPHRRARYW